MSLVLVEVDLPEGDEIAFVAIRSKSSGLNYHQNLHRIVGSAHPEPAWAHAAEPLPPALASRLPRWEYSVVALTSPAASSSEVQGILNHMARSSWQFVQVTGGALFFKRRLIP